MTAERTRRALVLQAEGDKQAAITRAEGERQAAVTRAEGEKQSAILAAEGAAQARLRNAEAEAEAIAQVARVMLDHGNPAQYLITQRYIESLKEMSRGVVLALASALELKDEVKRKLVRDNARELFKLDS